MHSDSGLSKQFSIEALSKACYLQNRGSATVLKGRTPHGALCGEKSNVKYLKSRGRDEYALVPIVEKRKLDAEEQCCVFVKYGSGSKDNGLFYYGELQSVL